LKFENVKSKLRSNF